MMNPSTVEQLKALRLVGMLEAWSEQQTTSTYQLDRIVHNALRLSLKGESMRKLTSPIQPDVTEYAIV